MTIPPEPGDEGQVPPHETPRPSDQPGGPTETPATGVPSGTEQSTNSTATAEGLPEWEPLTPELVEDEAIRGDFVIRWAIVGLALLFGFAQISESRTLVHIRSGEYMASHGFLPPSKDVFSCTATDRTWVNLGWLFDLLTAGVHSAMGGVGLSILQGVLAGITFGLIAHTYRAGIRTWWGSICAALALLACYPQFTVQPELVTLLGVGGLLWLLQRAEERADVRLVWSSVAVVWLWSQFDPRAFLGWMLLLAMALGEALRRGDEARQRWQLWVKVALASLAVTMIHPSLWNSLLAPVRLFAIDYPALQQAFPKPGRTEIGFYPVTFAPFWTSINHESIAAFVLFAATIVVLVLNRERLHPGHVIAVIIFNLLGCLATHELAAASLVNCVVCTINAQEWYRHRFGQVYSVDWRELLFSRGGRAVTVFCFFALAWLVISGRIDGPAGRRTGLGFHESLQVQMDSYKQIAADSLDDRPFHFACRQGDLLIWAGQKPFIDTRAGLYSGTGDADLIELHDRTRRAMQQQRKYQPGSGDPTVWKETFAKYQLTHTIPRLSGPYPAPDYMTFGDLLSSPEWVLTQLTASAAVFYRSEKTAPLEEYVSKNRFEFVAKAFRNSEKTPETTRVCAKAPTLTDTLFSVRQPRYSASLQLAGHFNQLGGNSGAVPTQMRAACAMLAARNATAALRDDSNSAEGYRNLGVAYLILDRVETNLMTEAGIRWSSSTRYLQAVAALQQAALLKPDDIVIQSDLLGVFDRMQRVDLALDCIKQIRRIRPVPETASDDEKKQREQLVNVEFSLEEALARIEGQVEQQLQNGADRFQIAAAAHQAGAVRLAIRTLEDEPIYKEQNPLARAALGNWLIEAGRVQEGLDAIEQSSSLGGIPGLRENLATSLVINGEYYRAIDVWREQLRETSMGGVQAALLTLPFLTLNPMWMGSDQYPFTQAAAAGEFIGTVRNETAALNYQIGMAQLELGDIPVATRSLQQVLDSAAETPLKPLVKFYLEMLTGKKIEDKKVEPAAVEEVPPFDGEAPAKDEAAKPETAPEKKP